MKKSVLTLVFWFLCIAGSPGETPTVAQLVIQSSWSGFAIPPHRQISVHIKRGWDGGYHSADGLVVDSNAIQDLLQAMDAPVNAAPSMADLGITENWLKQHFPAVETKNNELVSHKDASPRQRALYQRTFETPHLLRPVVEKLFQEPRHTDDYPFVRVTLTLENGATLQAESVSQHEFMLPWNLTRKGRRRTAFNSAISRAIARLLPRDGVNRERLNGEGLAEALGDEERDYIENDWNLIEADEKAGKSLSLIRSQYEVQKASIANTYTTYYGEPWKDDEEPQETNLIVEVKSRSYPKNFNQCAVLELRNGSVLGTQEFLDDAPRFEHLALSVPWLNGYLSGHPSVHAQIQFVHNASLAERGLKVFQADMHAIHQDTLAREVAIMSQKASLLIISEDNPTFYWLVLPDQRMVLWRYRGPTSRLAPFRGKDCSNDAPEAVGGCVGMVKLPDGSWNKTK